MELQYDYITGGGHGYWGNRVELDNKQLPAHPDQLIGASGCVPLRPVVGNVLLIDGSRNYTLTKFVEVEYLADPSDGFFGKVQIVQQYRKSDGVLLYDREQVKGDS